MYPALCFCIWTIIFTYLSWQSITISQQAIGHLKRLHQIPCNKCAYFTGSYQLKCTVNPATAMSEHAIGCQDFLRGSSTPGCNNCVATARCGNSDRQNIFYSNAN